MKHGVRTALVVLLGAATAAGQGLEVRPFPGDRIFPVFLADGLAHQLSITRVTDNREWIGAIGAGIPLVGASVNAWQVQLGAAATTFNRIIKTPGHITVYTVDYKVDFPLDVRCGNIAGRVAFGHVSAHFADDGIEILRQSSISYVRDYLTFSAAYDLPGLPLTTYLSADCNYHFEPIADRWIVQAGVQGGFLPVTSWMELYGAIDLKARQNVAWGTTQSYQAGVRLFHADRKALRLSVTYRTGFDERGQVFDRKSDQSLVGVTIDF